MDPVRRALFLLLFASVLIAEPGQLRAAIGAERAELPSTDTARWISALAVTLRQTVKPAARVLPAWRVFCPVRIISTPAEAQVAVARPTLSPHALDLPPPV